MIGISALIIEAPERFPHPFYHVRAQQEVTSYEPGREPSPEWEQTVSLILDFQNCEKCLLYYKLPSLWYFVISAQMDKDGKYYKVVITRNNISTDIPYKLCFANCNI